MPSNAELFRTLLLIRRTEEEIARVYPSDKIKSPIHLSIGQEAVAVAVCAKLRPDDVVFGSYRGHAQYIAKGGDLRAMLAELYGKATGCAHGKGGSMHLVDVARGVMGTSAIVATTIPHAVGYAWALRQRGSDAIVTAFFGDGATEEGVFAESLNLAALKRAPVLFVCENNGLAVHSRVEARQARQNIWQRAELAGVTAKHVDDGDVFATIDAAAELIADVRGGRGPRFLECATYRWKEHVGPSEDWALGYRRADEAAPWLANDQVARVGWLLPEAERRAIEADVEARVADAFAFAEASPFPEPDQLMTNLYAEPTAVAR